MDKTASERMKRYRNKKRNESPEGVTAGVTVYPPLIHALADPEKRAKLRSVCSALKDHNQLKSVYYGAGKYSVPFDVVAEYIECLK